MDPKKLAEIKANYNQWAAKHPEPDTKDLYIGTVAYSAKDIAREVEQETEVGKTFIDYALRYPNEFK